MAGNEKVGPSQGDPDLYTGSICLVEQDVTIDAHVREIVCALWREMGMRVVDMDVSVHDAMLARTSHLPHVVAAAVAQTAVDFGATSDFVGKGFLDVTRIAASRSEIWRDICIENRDALIESLEQMRRYIAAVTAMLTNNDAAGLEAYFEAGANARHRITES